MKASIVFAFLFAAVVGVLLAQDPLLSEAGSTFRVADNQLPNPLMLITYGDQRFTDPANTKQTDPHVRQWLVNQIAKEHPAAAIMNGDVPLAGKITDD